MIESIWIDDEYIKLNYPLPINMARENMLACIKMAQVTKLKGFTGDCLYDDLEGKIENESLSGDEEDLFAMLKYLLMFYSVIEMADFIRTENTVSTVFDRDQVMQSASEKADALENRASDFILSIDEIREIAQDKDCTDPFVSHNSGSSSGIYYPRQYKDNSCADGFYVFFPAMLIGKG